MMESQRWNALVLINFHQDFKIVKNVCTMMDGFIEITEEKVYPKKDS